jgi:hypothetical protein
MQTYEVVARVRLIVDADNADKALALAQQAIQAARGVEEYRWVRLQEVTDEGLGADRPTLPFGLYRDRL